MNTAEYLIKKLEELGINDFFGLPGDYNFNILYAVENNPKTNWIGCTNELNAGYAADGYARQRGYGAIITTYGVGELSAINAIAGSFAENVPVISIVGVPATKYIENKTLVHHNLNEVRPYAFEEAHKSIVETTSFLNKGNIKSEIDRILSVFVKERRPVYIAIPSDIALEEISDEYVDYNWSSNSEVLEEVIDKIIKKISEASKPVILGDVLVKRFDAKLEFKEFAAKSGIPVTNFLMGNNLINSDYDKYLGMYYSSYRNPIARQYLEETDCLIAVGPVYSDLNAFGFNLPYNINSHIAIYGTHTYIEDVKYENIKMSDVLEGISQRIEYKEYEFEKPQIGYAGTTIPGGELTSEYIYPRLQEYLSENDIIIAETGIIPHGICQMKFPQNVEVHTQTLWGSIGWATPATLGVCIANPNSRVILVTGDGSHQLTAMEIGNMLRLGIKPVIIVLNNKGYTIERILSQNPDDSFNDIVNMNYSKFARIFDGEVWATKVATEDDFDKALKVTQIMNKLCYIEICTDELDMPELTREVMTNFKSGENPVKSANQNYPDTKSITENHNYSIKFETHVHQSLKGLDE